MAYGQADDLETTATMALNMAAMERTARKGSGTNLNRAAIPGQDKQRATTEVKRSRKQAPGV